jgi:hypothetical protein
MTTSVKKRVGRPPRNGYPSAPHLRSLDAARERLVQVLMVTPKTDAECVDLVATLTRASNDLDHRLRMQAIVRKNKR